MRLLKLYSNKESFKTVEFNPFGLSIIVGKMESPSSAANRKNTVNGVGKSLTIALVNFCLGSSAKKGMTKSLKDWTFYLDFVIGDTYFTVKRTIDEPNKIFLNNKVYTVDNYRDTLENLLFDIPQKIGFLKFRSLISRFLRPYRASYESYDKAVPKEQDYARQLCNAFLLGLDVLLAEKKYTLKKNLDEVITLSKNIKKDEVLKEFLTEGKKVEFEVVNLKKQITVLDKKVKLFIIADNLDVLKKEADALSNELREARNRRTIIESAIKNIEKSLNIKPDLTSDQLISFYQEANVQLGQLIVKEIKEIETFNQKLLTDRKRRLEIERRQFITELGDLRIKIDKLGKLEDEKLRNLDSMGALDDYRKLMDELGRLRNSLERYETYIKLMEEYKIKQSQFEKELSEENINALNYLHSQKNLIDENILTFQNFAQQFYENKRSGIEITNDDGKNQNRYRISAEIQNDASDGINQVRLFCFDFTVLKSRHNHRVNFLFHDSRMLSEMDPRQRATVFQVAFNETLASNCQYIITVNQDLLDSFKEHLEDIEYKTIINDKTIILTLTDESDESKLLGIQVDMNYEED